MVLWYYPIINYLQILTLSLLRSLRLFVRDGYCQIESQALFGPEGISATQPGIRLRPRFALVDVPAVEVAGACRRGRQFEDHLARFRQAHLFARDLLDGFGIGLECVDVLGKIDFPGSPFDLPRSCSICFSLRAWPDIRARTKYVVNAQRQSAILESLR